MVLVRRAPSGARSGAASRPAFGAMSDAMSDAMGEPIDRAQDALAPAPRPVALPVALVVCGGRSTRFGSDKALAEVPTEDGGTTTLLARTLDRVARRSRRVIVATGSEARYAEPISRARAFGLDVTVVTDRFEDAGPLAGLEAGLAACAPDDDVLVVACDLPRLEVDALDALLAARRERGADVVLWRDAGGVHPLLGCYRAAVLPAVRAALERGERRLVAFHGGGASHTDPAGSGPTGPDPTASHGCGDSPQGTPGSGREPAGDSAGVGRVRVDYVLCDAGPDDGPAANANTRRELERLLGGDHSPSPRTP